MSVRKPGAAAQPAMPARGTTGSPRRRAEVPVKRAEHPPNRPPPPPKFTKTEQPGAEEPAQPQPDDARSAYLSLSGRADLVRDRAKAAELWQEPFRVWFPGGKDDPNIELIVVRPKEGEFWDNEGFNKIKYLFESAKAHVSGKTPEVAEGEQHGRMRL